MELTIIPGYLEKIISCIRYVLRSRGLGRSALILLPEDALRLADEEPVDRRQLALSDVNTIS